jgi:hypothetical protein
MCGESHPHVSVPSLAHNLHFKVVEATGGRDRVCRAYTARILLSVNYSVYGWSMVVRIRIRIRNTFGPKKMKSELKKNAAKDRVIRHEMCTSTVLKPIMSLYFY